MTITMCLSVIRRCPSPDIFLPVTIINTGFVTTGQDVGLMTHTATDDPNGRAEYTLNFWLA